MDHPELSPAEWRQRQEPRYPLSTGAPVFLGSREDGRTSFPYQLQDVSQGGAGVFVTNRGEMAALAAGDLINLHLPFQVNRQFFNQGRVRWERRSELGQNCGVQLEGRVPLQSPIYVAFETGRIEFELAGFSGPGELAHQILEDAFYFKKGVQIYFDHLRPYLARRSFAPGESPVSETIARSLEASIGVLDTLRNRAAQTGASLEWFSAAELERMRGAVLLELDVEKLRSAFDERVVWPYLRSIKLLEHQLYSNYNTLALLCARDASAVAG